MPTEPYTIKYRRAAPVASAALARAHALSKDSRPKGTRLIKEGDPIGERGRVFSQALALDADTADAGARAWLAALGEGLELVSVKPALPDNAIEARRLAGARGGAATRRSR